MARALGRNEDLNCLLVVEFCPGLLLDQVIWRAIAEKNPEFLKRKLAVLADFLATVHNKSAIGIKVDSAPVCAYCHALIREVRDLFFGGEA